MISTVLHINRIAEVKTKVLQKQHANGLVSSISNSCNFGFRQQYSIFHSLISLTEDIQKSLDKVNTGCGIFVNLQKPFDNVEHDILLAKLEHYGIRVMANNWFESCLFEERN